MKTEKYANYRNGWTTMRNGLHYNTPIPLYVADCSMLNKIYFIENLTPTIVSFRVRSFGIIRLRISDPRSLGSW